MGESKFIKGVAKLSNAFFAAENALTLVTFCIMLALIIVQVFVRFCLTSSLAWTEELIRTFFIISSFWGGAACVKIRQNVEINLLSSVVKKLARGDAGREQMMANTVDIFASLIGMVFSAVISYFMWVYTLDLQRQKQISIALEYPLFWVTAVITVALVLMGIHYLFHLLESLGYVISHLGKDGEA